MKNNPQIVIFSLFAVFFMFTLSVCSNDDNNDYRNISADNWKPEGRSIPYTYKCSMPTSTVGDGNAYTTNFILDPYEFYDDDDDFYWFDSQESSVYMIKTTEELRKLKEDNFNIAWYLRDTTYGESYFSKSSLILWVVSDFGATMSNWIHSLTVNKNTLMVNTLHGEYGPERISCTNYFVIQVRKDDVAGVSKVEVVTRNVGPIVMFVSITILDGYEKEYTVDDFGREYFSEVIHKIEFEDIGLNIRTTKLRLRTPGRKSAIAAREHLKTLDFIAYVYF